MHQVGDSSSYPQACSGIGPDEINVNSIGPGIVLTPFNQQAIDDPEF
jgi:hypothetical protein